MSNWSRDAARKFHQKKQDEKLKTQKSLQDQQLIGLHSPELWDSLRAAFHEEITAFNAEPNIGAGGLSCNTSDNDSDPLSVKVSRKDSLQTAVIKFDSERHSVTIEGLGSLPFKKLKCSVSNGNELVFVDPENRPLPANSIVEQVLTCLLGI